MTFKEEKSWVTQAGLPAVVVWSHDSYRCGYVEVTKDSIFHEVTNEREVQPTIQKSIDELDVHGGVTFFGTPKWAEGSNFFVGFDCAHAGDATRLNPTGGILRSLDYCIKECESLAKQLMSTDPVAALVVALEEINDPIRFMQGRLEEGAPDVAALVEALEGLLKITDESLGVSGYHLNGNMAKWCEFEEVKIAEEALALYHQQGGEL